MLWLWLALGALLGGCASAFPDEVMRSVNQRVTAEELRHDPSRHVDERVIVAGEILTTRPRPGETEMELLTRRRRRDDSPAFSDQSPGRVLLRMPDFLDPAVYAPGRRVTVVGTVTGADERKVGEIPYRYPVIAVERVRLWPKELAVNPAYSPAYPWGYWPSPPYYYPPHFGRPYRYYPPGWWW